MRRAKLGLAEHIEATQGLPKTIVFGEEACNVEARGRSKRIEPTCARVTLGSFSAR